METLQCSQCPGCGNRTVACDKCERQTVPCNDSKKLETDPTKARHVLSDGLPLPGTPEALVVLSFLQNVPRFACTTALAITTPGLERRGQYDVKGTTARAGIPANRLVSRNHSA
jgi:hypothetical protein